MNLLNSSLFFGFCVDEVFARSLAKHKPEYISLFVHADDNYLQELHHQGKYYLGKCVNNTESVTQLKLLEANIYSLLKKLVADYPYTDSDLVLLAFSKT